MKILLTGPIRIGKSTLTEKFIQKYPKAMKGFVVHRMKDEQGINWGYKMRTLAGQETIIAHRTLIQSPIVVGNGHNVDVERFEQAALSELTNTKEELIVIDEIGRMEAYSDTFMTLLTTIFASDQDLLATIVNDPEPWSLPFKTHPKVIVVEVTQENRDKLLSPLITIFEHVLEIKALEESFQEKIHHLLKHYLEEGKYLQIDKLCHHAIKYLKTHSYAKTTENTYTVTGDHGKYTVAYIPTQNNYTCECDLFNGKGAYHGTGGECSHIQTIKISTGE
jgi:nucleoside-triphosphatase THEP1